MVLKKRSYLLIIQSDNLSFKSRKFRCQDQEIQSFTNENIFIDGASPDQYQHLGNCPPTPPLTQQQSIDNNVIKYVFIVHRGVR